MRTSAGVVVAEAVRDVLRGVRGEGPLSYETYARLAAADEAIRDLVGILRSDCDPLFEGSAAGYGISKPAQAAIRRALRNARMPMCNPDALNPAEIDR